jgi:hypothetical protein
MVVNAKGTSRKHIKQLVSRFRDVNANLMGFSLNKLAQNNFNSYYNYSYGIEPNEETKNRSKFRKPWTKGKKQQSTKELVKE